MKPRTIDQQFLQQALDALSAHVAILDQHGRILAVNAGWANFDKANRFLGARCRVGDDYVKLCEAIPDDCAAEAPAAARGIRAVLNKQRDSFYIEYPCDGPDGPRWFGLRVTRFRDPDPVHVVIAHENITERKQAETNQQAAEKQLLALTERERLRAGHELHEGLAQQLTGIAFLTQTLEHKLKQKQTVEPGELEWLRELLTDSIGQATDLARRFYPLELHHEGWVTALRGLARTIQQLHDVECQVTAEEAVRPDDAVAIQLYRIVQELLLYLIANAGSTRLEVSLRRVDGQPLFQISANGQPLARDWSASADPALQLICYRAELIGATLRNEPSPAAGGTSITCVWPR